MILSAKQLAPPRSISSARYSAWVVHARTEPTAAAVRDAFMYLDRRAERVRPDVGFGDE